MYLLFPILFSLCGVLFVKRDFIYKRAKKVKTLFNLVKTQHTNTFKIVCVMSEIFAKTAYVWICQNLNGSLRQINKHTFEVNYVVGGVLYKLIIKPKRGPTSISHITDNENNDVYDLVRPYMGPCEDFHGHVFTPKFFEKEKLNFTYKIGDTVTFCGDEHIKLHPYHNR